LTNLKKILIIIQRSNGDVFLSLSLIKNLHEKYKSLEIDLLVNDDTIEIAKSIPNINHIHTFSYAKKQKNRLSQEKKIVTSLFKKYDLSINLTASDRSVIYALLSGKKSISAIEKNFYKSWWKKFFLSNYYYFDSSRHILINNLEPLKILNIPFKNIQSPIRASKTKLSKIKIKLKKEGINSFIIFHPSAQYNYKVYPKNQRDELLTLLDTLEIPLIITGGSSSLDMKIKKEIPHLSNIYNFIGETSLEDYINLSELALAYIGMDTLNMHIAASQNKRIFAIFGPTNLSLWSPWSNQLKSATSVNKPIQTYGKNTIFQSSLPCEVCGFFGCGSNHGRTILPYSVQPDDIFYEVRNWYMNRNA
jgi:heptosyltransferase III